MEEFICKVIETLKVKANNKQEAREMAEEYFVGATDVDVEQLDVCIKTEEKSFGDFRDSIEVLAQSGDYTLLHYFKGGQDEWNIAFQYNPETREWANGNYAYSLEGALATMLSKMKSKKLKSDSEIISGISYDRLSEIASKLCDGLFTDDEDSAIEYCKDTIEMTEDESDYFGIKDKLYEKKYKIVECEMIRTQKAKIKVAIPIDCNTYDVGDYIENLEDLEEENSEDWEIDTYDKAVSEIGKNALENNYDECEIWNYYDICNGCY